MFSAYNLKGLGIIDQKGFIDTKFQGGAISNHCSSRANLYRRKITGKLGFVLHHSDWLRKRKGFIWTLDDNFFNQFYFYGSIKKIT